LPPICPHRHGGPCNNQPHKSHLFAQHCIKAFVLGTSTEHSWCWKFWLVTMRVTHISGAAFFKHKYLTNPTVTPENRVVKAAGVPARALDNQMTPCMHESTIQAFSNVQDIFQQAAINYNVDPTTHVIPEAPPRVPLDTLPEPASPATSERVGTIKNRLLDHLPSSQLTEPPMIQECMTSPKHLLCQHDWTSWKILFPCNEYCHGKGHGRTH
jgi:hypothetical protein